MTAPEGRGRAARQPGSAALLNRHRGDLLLLGLLVGALALTLPRSSAPLSLAPNILLAAATLIPNALGMLLIHRANGFLSLMQVQVGVFAGVVFDGLVRGNIVAATLRSQCPTCVDPRVLGGWHVATFVIAGLLCLALAALLSWATYILVIRRFSRSSLLMPMVVTVFLAQALVGLQPRVTEMLVTKENLARAYARTSLNAPWSEPVLHIGGIGVTGWQLALVVLAFLAVITVTVLLRSTDWGLQLRSVSENRDRAATLGVNEMAVAARAWLLAGLLSGIVGIGSQIIANAAVAPAATGSSGPGLGLSVGPLVLILAILTFARFRSPGILALAALGLAAVAETMKLAFGSDAPLNAALVVVVVAFLALQRDSSARALRSDVSGERLAREPRPVPPELAGLDQVRTWTRLGLIAVVLALVSAPILLSTGRVSLLIDALCLALVALSIMVLTGWGGMVSLGQWGFALVGAWVAISAGLPFLPALLLAVVVGTGLTTLVALPALRLTGQQLTLVSLVFAVSAHTFFLDRTLLGRFLPEELRTPDLFGLDLSGPTAFYYLSLTVVVLWSLALVGLRRSRFGRTLIALRVNQAAAQGFGVNPVRARLGAFAIAGALAATAGALSAWHYGFLAESRFAADASIMTFIYTVIGGLGGIVGPLLGAALQACLTLFFGTNPLVVFAGAGIGAVLLLIVVPGGLAQLAEQVRDRSLLRLAYRLRIAVPSLMGDGGVAAALGKAPLEEKRRPLAPPGTEPLERYQPEGQWALERLGSSDQTRERVGEDR